MTDVRAIWALGRAGRADRGGVTAEFAVALPAVAVVLALLVGGIGAASAQVRAQEAAAGAARAMGRGGDPSGVLGAAGLREASVSGAERDGLVCATVHATAAPLPIPITAVGCAAADGS